MSSGYEGAAKTQAVIDLARDPESKVTSEDAQRTIVAESRKAGAPAFVFDANASPEEKARQAAASTTAIHTNRNKGAGLVSDINTGPDQYDLPPPTTASALLAARTSSESGSREKDLIEDQYKKTGWAPRFGTGETEEEKKEDTLLTDHQTLLEQKLDDSLYGDWYHNAAIIVFACLSSWLVAVLGGSVGWVIIIMVACGTYYRTSIRRTRRNFRDDVTREHALRNIELDHESLEWINSFMVKFWPIFAPNLATSVIQSVDQVLSQSTPAFLDSMRLKSFTLGTKPPRMEHVKTYAIKDDDIVQMDWKFSFTPNDLEDMTQRQIKNKIQPKVVLEIRVGKAMISKGLEVIVEDFAFSGLMRLKMKLQLPFPFIEKVDMCFMGEPDIDYVCKPLGGDTFGFDINFIPGLETFIKEQIHANLAPIMYYPHVFPIEIAKMLSGNPVDQAIGVVAITINSAHALRNTDLASGAPDPYVVCSIGGRNELGRTKVVYGSADPRWNETLHIIITSWTDSLRLQVFDFNEIRKDKELGFAEFPLERLKENPEHQGEQLPVTSSGKSRGVLNVDLRFFPVLEGGKDAEGHPLPPPESNTGIARITVEQAKELDGSKGFVGQLNPYAILILNGKEAHITKKLKRTNNPIFLDASKSLLITDKKKARIGVVIKDDRDLATDPVIGSHQIKLDDLLTVISKGQEWFPLSDSKNGRVKLTVDWKPVALAGVVGSGGYVTPIGVMRIHFQSAKGVRNLETIGKSDPYGRVLLNGIQRGRTVTFKNNLDPAWDEIIYVPVHSLRERVTLEVMDEEKLAKDRSLGSRDIPIAEYVREDEVNGGYATSDDKRVLSTGLRMDGKGTAQGVLNYTVSFFPTMNVIDPDDEEEEKAAQAEELPVLTMPAVNGTSSVARNSIGSDKLAAAPTTTPLTPTNPSSSDGNDATRSSFTSARSGRSGTKKSAPAIRLNAETLGQYQSGLLIFQIIEGSFSHNNYYLEVVMDDYSVPAYVSSKARTRQFQFNETGDAFVRELDFSKTTLRLVEKSSQSGDDEDEHVSAKVTGQTFQILQSGLYQNHQLTLRGDDGGSNTVVVRLKYLPVAMQLDPSESISNMGTLRVSVIGASDVPAGDSNGLSDPYAKFVLNDKEVYKTRTEKKTLQPVWNETFEVPVSSRTAAKFRCDVYDWDLSGKDDHLGGANIDLTGLEPLQQKQAQFKLDGASGVLKLGLMFKPSYITRARQGTSTFQGTFAPASKVVGAPVKGVVKLGGGVSKGASFLKRGFTGGRGGSKENVSVDLGQMTSPIPGLVGNGSTPTVSNSASGTPARDSVTSEVPSFGGSPSQKIQSRAASISSSVERGGAGEVPTGTAYFTIVAAMGYPDKADVQVVVSLRDSKTKEVHKTKAIKPRGGMSDYDAGNETFEVKCTADSTFQIIVRDHDLFRSKELGEGSYTISGQGAGTEEQVRVGAGLVTIRSRFVPSGGASAGGGGGGSSSAENGLLRPGTSGPGGSDSPVSKKEGRLSLFSRRDASGKSE